MFSHPPAFNAKLTASRRLNSHVASWKRGSREQQLDSPTAEHDQRDVKGAVCQLVDLATRLFEEIRVFQPCACRQAPGWCCRALALRSQWSSPRRSWGSQWRRLQTSRGHQARRHQKAAPPPKVDKKTALLQKLVGLRLAYGHKPPPGM